MSTVERSGAQWSSLRATYRIYVTIKACKKRKSLSLSPHKDPQGTDGNWLGKGSRFPVSDDEKKLRN